MTLKRSLTQEQGAEALRTLTLRNQILAASRRNNFSTGTLRFRADIPKQTRNRRLIFIIYYFWIHLKLRYFVSFLTVGKVIRKNHITLRLKSNFLSGKQSFSKPQGQKKNKRPRVKDSITTSEVDRYPLRLRG